jgi:hypothetical protein
MGPVAAGTTAMTTVPAAIRVTAMPARDVAHALAIVARLVPPPGASIGRTTAQLRPAASGGGASAPRTAVMRRGAAGDGEQPAARGDLEVELVEAAVGGEEHLLDDVVEGRGRDAEAARDRPHERELGAVDGDELVGAGVRGRGVGVGLREVHGLDPGWPVAGGSVTTGLRGGPRGRPAAFRSPAPG